MMKLLLFALLGILLVSLTACAAGPNEMGSSINLEGNPAGFWQGLWHGFIAPVTFIISLFNHNVSVYEVHNNGGWYNFGFIFGLMVIFSGSRGAGSKAWPSKKSAARRAGRSDDGK
jgi:hypothetical protein